jgi:hypothetical protein
LDPVSQGLFLALILEIMPSVEQTLGFQKVLEPPISAPLSEDLPDLLIVAGENRFNEFKDKFLAQVEVIPVGNLDPGIPIYYFFADFIQIRILGTIPYFPRVSAENGRVHAWGSRAYKKEGILDVAEFIHRSQASL